MCGARDEVEVGGANRHPRRAVLASFGLAVALATAVGAELAVRATYAIRESVLAARGATPTKLDLAPFEYLDPEHPGNYLLRAGARVTLGDALAHKRVAGRVLGLRDMAREAEELGIRESDVIFSVNAQGYKGPELDPARARPRILAIGDSCTFGTWFDAWSYPRALERALATGGTPAEVVNAGVGGYAPANALARIDEFKTLAPDVTLVYIGWNALYGENTPFLRWWERIQLVRLGRTLYRLWVERGKSAHEIAIELVSRGKRPDPAAPELARLRDYEPSFVPQVAKILDEMRSAGSRVFVATLPGLFVSWQAPAPEALEKGHLPSYTANPYAMAAVTDRYNDALRRVASETGAELVDLDAWSRDALVPRHVYFTDNVHLTPQGQTRIGEWLATRLAPAVAAQRRPGS